MKELNMGNATTAESFIALCKRDGDCLIYRAKPNHDGYVRVSVDGKKWITGACGLPIYHFRLNDRINNQHLLQLDHLITSPYYIRSRSYIELFGENDAIMLSLHAGNLARYLDTLDID
jgi:hypothetical protein